MLRLFALATCCALLTACANLDGQPILQRWPEGERGAVTSYLQSLREYLAMSPEQREWQRQQLRESADQNGRAEKLEYALALSVELGDTAALQLAQEHFENLLATPSPLPVALDGLVRLQLASVMSRLDALGRIDNLRETARSCGSDHEQCRATVMALSEELEVQNEELASLKRKLEALTRIEQTVNDGQDDDRVEVGEDNGTENDHATTASDTSGR